jgi:heptosyltransferase I
LNILIVKLSAIGDVVHTLPSLVALRRCYPDAEISWVVEEAAADLLTDHPDLGRVLISRRKTWLKEIRQGRIANPLREMRAFLRELRSRRYDLVIDFHGLLKSAVIVLLSGGKRKLGYDSLQEGSGFFYNEKIPEDVRKHAVDRYLDLVRHVAGESGTAPPAATPELEIPAECQGGSSILEGNEPSRFGSPATRQDAEDTLAGGFGIAVGEKEKQNVAALLNENSAILAMTENGAEAGLKWSGGEKGEGRAFVAVNPVAFWETKLWQDEKFAELCDRIRTEIGIGVVLTGGEAGRLDRICGRMKTAAANLGGRTTLRELACLYRQASLVVTTDSGPMHIAAAVGTPVVALFGPTDPDRTGPYGPGHRVIRRELPCSPCLRKQCETKKCMQDIGVGEVFDAVREMVSLRGTSYRLKELKNGNQQGTVGDSGLPEVQGGGSPDGGGGRSHLRPMPSAL